MRIRDGYIIRKLDSTYYLLPEGQNIATHQKSIALNDTSLFLCEQLQQNISLPDLLRRMEKHYDATEQELPILRNDLLAFIEQLQELHILTVDYPVTPIDTYLSFGPVSIGYHGPATLLHPSFSDFICPSTKVNQHWYLISDIKNTEPVGQLLIRTQELRIYYHNDCYDIFYENTQGLVECQISSDLHTAWFFCIGDINDSLTEELFHGFRMAFSLIAQSMHCYLLHSASIVYREKLWLFSGSSGTGKSTHTALWNQLFHTPIVNGDINLLSMEDDNVIVSGTPWCGTSNLYDNKRYPLGGIVLLQQDKTNGVKELSFAEKQLSVMQRMISPSWIPSMVDSNLNFAALLANHTNICRLHCNTTDEAAHTMKQYIDTLYDF